MSPMFVIISVPSSAIVIPCGPDGTLGAAGNTGPGGAGLR